MAHNLNASTASSFNPFNGHLGHLSPAQEDALAVFKDLLIKENLYYPKTDTSEASHDDATLLRFLRARSFQPAAAQKQFTNAELWRKKHDVDNLYASFDTEEFEHAKKFYPRWTGRRDKNGLPVYIYRLVSLDPIHKERYSIHADRRYQRIIALYEFMTRFSFGLCSHLPHPSQRTPVTSTVSIMDLEHVSFSSMWKLRHHLQEASRLATANYPETLGVIAVVNAPSFFPTIWGWIKGWFDEGTRNKIHILGRDPGSTLRELIDPKDLPEKYGGELDWKFEDEPNLDEQAKQVLGTMPRGPVVFKDGTVSKPDNTQDAVGRI